MGAMQNQMPTHVAKIESLCARLKGSVALQLRSVPELISISRCPMTNALLSYTLLISRETNCLADEAGIKSGTLLKRTHWISALFLHQKKKEP